MIAPVQLWIGGTEQLHEKAYGYFEGLYNPTGLTHVTHQIRSRTFAQTRWIMPTKGAYKRSDLQDLFAMVYRSCAENEIIFYIFPLAHQLNAACANSLLKLMEEPPTGVHFLLFAPASHLVLPTIVSRSVITTAGENFALDYALLLPHFCQLTAIDAVRVTQAIDDAALDDQQVILFLHALETHWRVQYRAAMTSDNHDTATYAERMERVIAFSYQRLPVTGSTKLFLRNLFLMMLAAHRAEKRA